MSYTCDPKRLRIFGSHFNAHVKREIYNGLKMKNREGSAYDFFNSHGIKINIETIDGTPLPDELKTKLSLETPSLIGSRLGKKGNNKRPKGVLSAESDLSSTVAVSSDDAQTPVNVRPETPVAAEPEVAVAAKKPAAKRTRKATTVALA